MQLNNLFLINCIVYYMNTKFDVVNKINTFLTYSVKFDFYPNLFNDTYVIEYEPTWGDFSREKYFEEAKSS